MHETDVLVGAGRGDPPPDFISVVIPALNEALEIGRTLDAVDAQHRAHEVVVVDGGSVDATAVLASERARVIYSPRGRAVQMNRGAAAARGDVLLFLHADTLLPMSALDDIAVSIAGGAEAGAFRLEFDTPSPLLRLYSFCTRFPLPRLCFGDRAIFVRRDIFERIGGYREIPMFEDLELVRTLRKRGHFTFLSSTVTTSARRFRKAGPMRQQLRNAYLWLHYLAGSDPANLDHLYRYD